MKIFDEGYSSQIENVQKFAEVIGDEDYLWGFLLGRSVTHSSFGWAKVNGWNEKTSEILIDYPLKTRIKFKTVIKDYLIRYTKEVFLQEFSKIDPPLLLREILELIRVKQESKRQEIDKQEAKRQIQEKLDLLKKLQQCFQQDFLNTYKFYQAECSNYITLQEYQAEKSSYVKSWVQQNLGFEPDLEQATAIGAVEGHVQVVARAGSGKTSTLVNRALFLQNHCDVLPNEMLLLAFNKKAVKEIEKRLSKQLQSKIPHVMTFHALAYALVHPEESILFDDSNGCRSKSRALQSIIDDYLRDPDYLEEIRALMTAHFRADWERIVAGRYNTMPEEMLRYRRSLPRQGLDGTPLKSFGEKVIADFLFEHDIKYKYEYNHWWSGINYRPDFTVFTGEKQGIVIEYFGLEGDPDYDAMSDQKREYWRNKPNWRLLEFFPNSIRNDGVEGFCASLKQSLEALEVTCNHLSEEEIWQKIRDRAIDRFTIAMKGFIERCRKLSLSSEKLSAIIDDYDSSNDVEWRFLDLAQVFYKSYLERIQATGEDDFDGLIQKATEIIAFGETVFRRTSGTGDLKLLKYILIDEYQDFSDLFHRLIKAIRCQNSQVHFFCVGDDWQAINGFAGSDLYFYQNFEQFFQPSFKLNIATNYRSASAIVEIGNTLMQEFGTLARAHKTELGIVEIVELETFKPTTKEEEEYKGHNIIPVILRLVGKAIRNNKEVVLLSRKNNFPWYVNYDKQQANTLDNFLELLRCKLPKEFRDAVSISNVHQYKGLEKKVVIVLDAISSCYPSLHPDSIFTRVLGDTIEKVVNEERRLFYVALTRAVEHLCFITEANNMSPFLEELRSRKHISSLNWSNYPPFVGATKHITVKIGNQNGRDKQPTFKIKDLLKAEGYQWNSTGWQPWFRTYPQQDFSVQKFFTKALWISKADGVEVRFYDDLESLLKTCLVDKGQWRCVVDNCPDLNL